ncbi:hypothetical protein WDU94_005770 [Cyamophila willieti]
MRVKTPVLSQHKIKARHKLSGASYRQVSVLLVIVIYLIHCASGSGSAETNGEDGTRRLNKRSPRLYDDDVRHPQPSALSRCVYNPPDLEAKGKQIVPSNTNRQGKMLYHVWAPFELKDLILSLVNRAEYNYTSDPQTVEYAATNGAAKNFAAS